MTGQSDVPSINPLYRFQFEKAQDCYVLLYPEGMIKLNGSAGEIMSMIDGRRSVESIITALKEKFPDAKGIEQDIIEFLEDARHRRWLQFDS